MTTLVLTAAAALIGVALLGGFLLGRPAASPSREVPVGAGSAQLASDNSASTTSPATITVTATGQVSGTPDTVAIDIGINANESSASAALDQASTEMSTLESVYLSHGVTKSDLQTSNLSLNPNYDSGGKISGYSAEEDLTVTMHDIGLAGSLVDTASHAVGNFGTIQDIQFSISNTSGLLASARAQAMRNAELEAQELAVGAGDSLGPIRSVTDEEQQQSPPVEYQFGAAVPAAANAAVPLEAGKQSLSIQVEVVYELLK